MGMRRSRLLEWNHVGRAAARLAQVEGELVMRTIIAGPRDCYDPALLLTAILRCGWTITRVVGGKATGVDTLGECWAIVNGIPFDAFPADWATYGKSAGFKRNLQMAVNADALLALWNRKSPGTKHMIDIATSRGLRVYVHYFE